MSAPCGFAWCNNDHPGHEEHTWTDAVRDIVRDRRVYVWTSVQDGYKAPIIVGVDRDGSDEYGGEAFLTMEAAEYLRDALSRAIRNAREAGR